MYESFLHRARDIFDGTLKKSTIALQYKSNVPKVPNSKKRKHALHGGRGYATMDDGRHEWMKGNRDEQSRMVCRKDE